jgi:hypothetical protein
MPFGCVDDVSDRERDPYSKIVSGLVQAVDWARGGDRTLRVTSGLVQGRHVIVDIEDPCEVPADEDYGMALPFPKTQESGD